MDIEAFRNVANTYPTQNQARVTIGEGDQLSVQQKVSFVDKFGRAFRVSGSKANIQANNEIRRQLAMSLGSELGISTEDYGKLLQTLQKTLGKNVFNADYFKGSGLKSGRPLSSRRIAQIVSAMDTVIVRAVELGVKGGGVQKAKTFSDALSSIGSDDIGDEDDNDVEGEGSETGLNSVRFSQETTTRLMENLAAKPMPDPLRGLGGWNETETVEIRAEDKADYEKQGYTVEKGNYNIDGFFGSRKTKPVKCNTGKHTEAVDIGADEKADYKKKGYTVKNVIVATKKVVVKVDGKDVEKDEILTIGADEKAKYKKEGYTVKKSNDSFIATKTYGKKFQSHKYQDFRFGNFDEPGQIMHAKKENFRLDPDVIPLFNGDDVPVTWLGVIDMIKTLEDAIDETQRGADSETSQDLDKLKNYLEDLRNKVKTSDIAKCSHEMRLDIGRIYTMLQAAGCKPTEQG